MRLSIITTIYKAEKDLPRLLDSMMQQMSPELEFFLIDNGSPDRCGDIAAEYAKRDSRFTLYTIKDNIGYIRARNEGIRVCTGDYIGFCDSDDYLEPGGYDRAIEKIHETDCDLYITSYRTHSGEKVFENKLPYNAGLYEGVTIKEEILPNAFGPCNRKGPLRGFMWKEIFRHNLVGDLTFDESLKPYEDQVFNFDAIARCKRLYIDDNPIYNYIINPESITARMASTFDFAAEYKLVHHLFEEEKKRATEISQIVAICTDCLISLYSMFLFESRIKGKSTNSSVESIHKSIEHNWIKEVVLSSEVTSLRMKFVKWLLRYEQYGILLNVMKIMNLFILFAR